MVINHGGAALAGVVPRTRKSSIVVARDMIRGREASWGLYLARGDMMPIWRSRGDDVAALKMPWGAVTT